MIHTAITLVLSGVDRRLFTENNYSYILIERAVKWAHKDVLDTEMQVI